MSNANVPDSPEELFELAKRFYLPSRGEADPLLGYFYLSKAVEKNYAPAQRFLGTLHLDGLLMARDYEKAHFYLAAAARQGDAVAAYHLAIIYAQGLGVTKDWQRAYAFLSQGPLLNHPEARRLRESLKSELSRHYPEVNRVLCCEERARRMHYTQHQNRFIMPWTTEGRDFMAAEEFQVWLDLNLNKIDQTSAAEKFLTMMRQYYQQMEAKHLPAE